MELISYKAGLTTVMPYKLTCSAFTAAISGTREQLATEVDSLACCYRRRTFLPTDVRQEFLVDISDRFSPVAYNLFHHNVRISLSHTSAVSAAQHSQLKRRVIRGNSRWRTRQQLLHVLLPAEGQVGAAK